MKNLSAILLVLLPIILIHALISCNKEATINYESDTIKVATIFQPDSITGENAIIENISPDINFGNYPIIAAFAWTDTGFFNVARSLIKFDLSKISPFMTIKSAKLTLYFNSYSNLNAQTGENDFTIYRIAQPWNVSTVTWNNQPAISNLDSVAALKSTSVDQSYKNIDVTNLVRDIINNPSVSFGFLLKLNNESPYGLVVFGSCYNNDSSVHPKLIIYY